jgi:hypothetical protein
MLTCLHAAILIHVYVPSLHAGPERFALGGGALDLLSIYKNVSQHFSVHVALC